MHTMRKPPPVSVKQGFLDEMDREALEFVAQALRRLYQLEDINSVITVAVAANLRLYVKEKIS